ncbi:hypothetical protein KJ557_02480 [Patescibacteria group bacterium]|nr:hypothetical protein [Patescibacteria group bacterium]MBU1956490.1 hypothetical protein [Patescibacteria group bacterium]MBU2010540.1 hypothetical protein [Patescibacteria group bacterium]
MKNSKNISWEAPEYLYREKSSDWFWSVGIIAFAGVVSAYMFGNVLLAILILLCGFTLALFGAKKPRVISFSISRKGVRVESILYPFQNLESFWILEKEHENILLLKSHKMLTQQIVVPLGDTDPDQVQMFLEDFIPGEEENESLAERIMDRLGF